MQSTKERFAEYQALEASVLEKVRQLADLGGRVTRISPTEQGALYDATVILEAGEEVKLEVQITEAAGFQQYGDVRLDLLSAYSYKTGILTPEIKEAIAWRYIPPEFVDKFLESLVIARRGKLYDCEADLLAYAIMSPINKIWLFRMDCLKANRQQFLYTHGIRINKKVEEAWESAFIAVPAKDDRLNSCCVLLDW